MSLRDVFAANLRRLRLARGWSQEELGFRTGLARNYIGRLERCENAATLDAVEAIAKALHVEAGELVG